LYKQKNIEFGNEGYLEKGDLIFELMENNKANIIGKIITSKKIELKINLSLKNEFKKNNNIQIKDIFQEQRFVYQIDNNIEKISNNLIGFINLGNTCYINSSLQILIHIPGFIEIILNYKYLYEHTNTLLYNIIY
jgi:ubiquitin C-terminal hydrolase